MTERYGDFGCELLRRFRVSLCTVAFMCVACLHAGDLSWQKLIGKLAKDWHGLRQDVILLDLVARAVCVHAFVVFCAMGPQQDSKLLH